MCIRDRYQRRVHGGSWLVCSLEQNIVLGYQTQLLTKISPVKNLELVQSVKFLEQREKLQALCNSLSKKQKKEIHKFIDEQLHCLLYTSPSPRDRQKSRMPSSA
eukprot:TRINITY_DN19121_c0_g1_i1.p1 TRINITY_DN19121_c0_g1~~TRINITY_DN19121_c0_g1_i1.p1  ORF type:complete len:104 (-),score=32.39 TRINITY_DN19121_c0_g1_i1:10-321(-)